MINEKLLSHYKTLNSDEKEDFLFYHLEQRFSKEDLKELLDLYYEERKWNDHYDY